MTEHPEHIVRLTSTPTEREAAVIIAELQEQGISSTMTGQITAGFRAGAPGWVHVLVAEEDLTRAQEVLAKVGQEQDNIDWSQVDVGEPETAPEIDRADRLSRRLWRGAVATSRWIALALLLLLGYWLLWRR